MVPGCKSPLGARGRPSPPIPHRSVGAAGASPQFVQETDRPGEIEEPKCVTQ